MTYKPSRSNDGARSLRLSATEWAELFDAHHNAIWRYLCHRAGPTIADDLAGEVFLRALRTHSEPAHGAERAWLYGIATNLLRERARKEVRRLRAYARLATPVVDALDQDAVATRLDAAANGPALAAEMANLEPNDRDTLLLHALTELDYAGIAVATGVPIGTVRSRLHRARRRLQQTLSGLDAESAGATTIETRTA